VRALDAVDGAVPIDCSLPPGAVFVVGRTHVTCTAADRAGNVANGGFDIVVAPVTIADRTPPRLALPSGIRVVAPAGGRATPVRFRARATDERDGDVPVRCAPASGSRFGVGRTTVRCSATDRAGNTGAGSFVVLVAPPRREPEPAPDEDPRPAEGTGTTPGGDTATTPTTPDPDPDEVGPVFERFPDIQQTGTSSDGAIVNYNPPRAVDDRDGPVDVSCTPPSGSFFAIGSQGVTCTARDRAGNVSTASATVTVDPPPTGE
jgi:hypothetical protein